MEFEEQAFAKAFEFDTGESQLVAILLTRNFPLLLTGHKRAIAALAGIGLNDVNGRIACLEQLVSLLLGMSKVGELSPPSNRASTRLPKTGDRPTSGSVGSSMAGVAS